VAATTDPVVVAQMASEEMAVLAEVLGPEMGAVLVAVAVPVAAASVVLKELDLLYHLCLHQGTLIIIHSQEVLAAAHSALAVVTGMELGAVAAAKLAVRAEPVAVVATAPVLVQAAALVLVQVAALALLA